MHVNTTEKKERLVSVAHSLDHTTVFLLPTALEGGGPTPVIVLLRLFCVS